MRTDRPRPTTTTIFAQPQQRLAAGCLFDDASLPTTEPLPVRRPRAVRTRGLWPWPAIEPDTLRVLVLSVVLLAVVAGWAGP